MKSWFEHPTKGRGGEKTGLLEDIRWEWAEIQTTGVSKKQK